MLKKLYLLLLIPLFLTGCVQTESQLTINKDNSAVYEQKIYTDGSLFDGNNPRLKVAPDREQKKKNLEAQTGMKFKEFHQDGKIGTIGTRKIYDLRTDDWNSTLNNKFYKIRSYNDDALIVDIKTGFFKTDYKIDMEVMPIAEKQTPKNSLVYESVTTSVPNVPKTELTEEVTNENADVETEAKPKEPTDPNKVDDATLAELKAKYTIKIPVRAYYHNSQDIDTKSFIYKWDLNYKSYTPIKLKYSVYNVVNILTVFVILLILVGELFYFALYKKS